MQSWSGLPTVIRLNATHFSIYKTGDLKQLKQIYENFATYVNFDEFMKVYDYAVSQPHGFLFIDTDPKDPSMRFRSNSMSLFGCEKLGSLLKRGLALGISYNI